MVMPSKEEMRADEAISNKRIQDRKEYELKFGNNIRERFRKTTSLEGAVDYLLEIIIGLLLKNDTTYQESKPSQFSTDIVYGR